LSAKRQVTLPIRVVEDLGLEPGDQLRVDAEGDKVILSRTETVGPQRVRLIKAVAGSLTGSYGPNYLKKLRSEWR
jgi:AbrB family looped-hinge helix DNA binding protein